MTTTDLDLSILHYMDPSDQMALLGVRSRMWGRIPTLAEVEAACHRLHSMGLVEKTLNGFQLSDSGLSSLGPMVKS